MAKKNLTITVRAKNMMARGLKSAQAKLRSFGSSVARIGRGLALAFAGAATGLVVAMVKAQEFGKQIGQIATLTEMTTRTVAKEVRKMSAEFGMAKEELTKGLYDALSAGVPKENVFSFMKIAAKAAKAGAAEVQVAVEATTRIMDSYGESAGSATHINDMLFKTVKKGVITYDQLAGQIGKVAGIAQKAGIPLEDLLAVIATGSKTVNAEQLFTGIRSVIMSLGKTAEGSELMIKKGLGGALAAVVKSTGGTLFGLRSVINEARALPIALAVAGKNTAKFKQNLDEVTFSAGSMMKAFKKMDKTNSLDKLSESLKNVMLAIGGGALQSLAPTIERAARAAAEFAERVADWFDEGRIKRVRDNIEGITNALLSGDTRSEAVEAIGNVLIAYFKVGAEGAISLIIKAAPKIGRIMGEAAKAAFTAISGKSFSEKEAITQLLQEGKLTTRQALNGTGRSAWDSEDENDARIKLIKTRAREIDDLKLINRLGLRDIKGTQDQTAAEVELETAMKKVSDIAKVGLLNKERVGTMSEDTAAWFERNKRVDPVGDQKKGSKDFTSGMGDAIRKLKILAQKSWKGTNEFLLKTRLDVYKKMKQEEKEKITEIAALEKQEAANRLEEINKKIEATKRIAGMSVKGIQEEGKQKKDEEDQWAKDKERANKIWRRQQKGYRGPQATGRRKQEDIAFLEAARKKRGAELKLAGLNQQQRDEMENPLLKSSNDIKRELIMHNRKLDSLMRGG